MFPYLLDLVGVAVFAASGVMAAHRHHFDGIGVLVLAMVTAVGGGTLRDVLLDLPVFWIDDPMVLWVILGAALATVVIQRVWHKIERSLLLADACGLALFCVAGAQRATEAGAPAVVAAMMGLMTGVVGGMVRDILCGQVPMVLRTGEVLYATPALLGATTYILLLNAGTTMTAASIIAMTLALGLRLSAMRWRLSLPSFWAKSSGG